MPLPLISPFPTTVAHLHPRPSSSIRIPYRHLCCRCGRTHFLFLCRLLRSAATPFGLCPRSFLHNPPLGFVRPLPSTLSLHSLTTWIRFRTIHLLPGQQLPSHFTHAPGRCLELQSHVEVFSRDLELLQASHSFTIFTYQYCLDHYFTTLYEPR